MNSIEMTDEDILDYLMTSDFNEGLSDKEAQLLLLKFRQFYRFQVSKNVQLNHSYEKLSKDSSDEFQLLKEAHDLAISALRAEQEKNERELNRRLTFKEIFTGKIKRNKKNEIR